MNLFNQSIIGLGIALISTSEFIMLGSVQSLLK
jgi:hypothetical protein